LRFFGTFLAVLVGLPIIRYTYASSWRPGFSTSEWLTFVGMLLLTVHAVIAVHELGHLLGGRLVGFRFRLLVVGPLRIVADDDRLRLGLNRNLIEYAGVAGSAPEDATASGPEFTKRMAIVLAAGPILSLLAGGLALALLLADVPDSLFRSRFTEFVAFRVVSLFAAGSLAVGLVTLLPGGTRNRPTDGSRILQLLAHPDSGPRTGGTASHGGGTVDAASTTVAGSTREDA
jgi:hypothetical protein